MSRRIGTLLALGFLVALALGCVQQGAQKQVTISGGKPSPWSLHVVKNGLNGAPDRVVWKNEDPVAHTLSFLESPFGPSGQRFTIQPNSSSPAFVVDRGAATDKYPYQVNPFFQGAAVDSGPGPDVIVED